MGTAGDDSPPVGVPLEPPPAVSRSMGPARAVRGEAGPHAGAPRHLKNILTYLTHRITNAVADGLNATIQ
ncbi:MAG: hypothetical protein JWM95_2812 [Gemmatimonadetes bacterium]|nr:hypothetical protein [Gemmatimonadota bacterium]